MASALRKTGIDIVGDMPWGTHFGHTYETRDDLLDTLVPYFKAGLEDNEFCVWVVSEPLTEGEAWKAPGGAVPDLDPHVARRSLEIFRARDWYLRGAAPGRHSACPRPRPRGAPAPERDDLGCAGATSR